jgi:3-oxoacyl-[acyl-carrier protein] reductase
MMFVGASMDLQLSGKRALVTGSSVGIGESIARALAREGVTVAVHGRDPERTQCVADEIGAAGGKAVVVLGDLTQDEEVTRMLDEAERLLGGIDILVNNAGGSGKKQVWEKTAASKCSSFSQQSSCGLYHRCRSADRRRSHAGFVGVVQG